MKVIARARQEGKTEELIKMSADTGCVIVCLSMVESEQIRKRAIELGLTIPRPATYFELMARDKSVRGSKLLIDNAELLLERIINEKIEAITVTVDQN
jgi:hypothetical protein